MKKNKKNRPSPSQSAAFTKSGAILKGNDKVFWVCKEFTNKVKRWVRTIPLIGAKSYITHDNGGRPFKVFLSDKSVEVYSIDFEVAHQIQLFYQNQSQKSLDKKIELSYFKKVLSVKKYKNIFLGRYKGRHYPNTDKSNLGNSVLIHQEKNNYIFIGRGIFTFKAQDQIFSFYSPLGNSDVPYPWAKGHQFTYLMEEAVYIENRFLKKSDDPYLYYYKLTDLERSEVKKKNSFKFYKIKVPRICG